MAFGRKAKVVPPVLNNTEPDSASQNIKTRARSQNSSDRRWLEVKSSIRDLVADILDASALEAGSKESTHQYVSALIRQVIADQSYDISTTRQRTLVQELCDEILGFGPLEPLLARDDIADIMVNGPNNVFIEVDGRIEQSPVTFHSEEQLMQICQRIVRQVGRRVDESSPICDARLLDGSRVNVIAPPLAVDGASLTIRKFKKDKLRLSDLVTFGSLTRDCATLLSLISQVRCNVIISGGTGSGKTTLLNSLTSFIDDGERTVTCEDTAELQLQQAHVVRLETRPPNIEGQGEVTMGDLVKNCLRMRPDRIIVGEVRGGEAFDLLQAMNTGHDGSMGTLHANSPREALFRLESMITASKSGAALPSTSIREMIANSVDVIVQAQRLRGGRRVITAVSEIMGTEGGTIVTQDLIKFEQTGLSDSGKVLGRHVGTGIGRPAFARRADEFGVLTELIDLMQRINEP